VGGRFATRGIIDIASRLNPDSDHDRLQMAVDCIAAIGLNPALEAALRSDDPDEASLAVEAVSRMKDASAENLLMDVFWRKDRDMQRDLVRALVAVGDAEATEFFLDVLDRHEDGTVLKGALYFLGEKLRLAEAADRIFAMLEHPFNDVKEAALEACIALGGEDMARRFEALFASDDPIQRMMAVYAMGRLNTPEALTYLRRALEDEVPDIRKIALEALDSVCREDILELVGPRLSDENREVRLTVVNLLGACPEKGAVAHLLTALHDEDDWVRIRAVEALGELKDPVCIPQMVELLASDNKLVVLKAVEALGKIGGKTAFRALMSVAETDDPELQTAAEEAIGWIQEEQGE
jgi:HEAT repeat protein